MSLNFQLAQRPTQDDPAFYNVGSSDITAKQVVVVDTSHVMGTAADGPCVTLPATGGSRGYAFGVAIATLPALGATTGAGAGPVRVSGQAVCIAAGAVAKGDVVSADASVAGAVSTTTTGVQFGIALSTAADTEDVLVLIQPARNA